MTWGIVTCFGMACPPALIYVFGPGTSGLEWLVLPIFTASILALAFSLRLLFAARRSLRDWKTAKAELAATPYLL